MPISAYARDTALDHVLNEKVFFSLHTAEPGLTGLNELANYNRVAGNGALGKAKDGQKSTTGILSFKSLPECVITHVGIYDAAKGGNFLWSLKNSKPKRMDAGDTLQIDPGHLTLALE